LTLNTNNQSIITRPKISRAPSYYVMGLPLALWKLSSSDSMLP